VVPAHTSDWLPAGITSSVLNSAWKEMKVAEKVSRTPGQCYGQQIWIVSPEPSHAAEEDDDE
jgi:hypothetical protein